MGTRKSVDAPGLSCSPFIRSQLSQIRRLGTKKKKEVHEHIVHDRENRRSHTRKARQIQIKAIAGKNLVHVNRNEITRVKVVFIAMSTVKRRAGISAEGTCAKLCCKRTHNKTSNKRKAIGGISAPQRKTK